MACPLQQDTLKGVSSLGLVAFRVRDLGFLLTRWLGVLSVCCWRLLLFCLCGVCLRFELRACECRE